VIVLNAALSPPFGIVSRSYFAFPYIVAFLAVLIIVLVLLVKFPSFRNYRRKRNILIYFVVALMLVLLVYQIDFVTRIAVVSYSIDTSRDRFYLGEVNEISVNCISTGDRACSFYLVVSSVNATFSAQNPQTYLHVNTTIVKVPFLLQERWSSMNADSKPVFFTIDENVTGFSFRLSLESQGYSSVNVFEAPVSSIWCVWNATEGCYMIEGGGGFIT
jgi:hypothetical protein